MNDKSLITEAGAALILRMSWMDFVTLPEKAQIKYIDDLRRIFCCGVADIAEMMGCKKKTLVTKLELLGMDLSHARRTRDPAKLAAWEAFIGKTRVTEDPAVSQREESVYLDPEDLTTEEAEMPEDPAKTDRYPAKMHKSPVKMLEDPEIMPSETEEMPEAPTATGVYARLLSFEAELTGPIDDVMARLQAFADAAGDVHVTVRLQMDPIRMVAP